MSQKPLNTTTVEKRFFSTLLGFSYVDETQIEHQIKKAAQYARKIPAFSRWPDDPRQFWNAEASCWNDRIKREVRDSIRAELSTLHGKNLDLGAGSVSYLPNSVAVDFSRDMLHLNPAQEKVIASLEEKLPFKDKSFDSVTLFFVVNYIKNIHQLLEEVHRLLRVHGQVVIVQSPSVSSLHKQHYKNSLGGVELRSLLGKFDFKVKSEQKKLQGRKLLFMYAEKMRVNI